MSSKMPSEYGNPPARLFLATFQEAWNRCGCGLAPNPPQGNMPAMLISGKPTLGMPGMPSLENSTDSASRTSTQPGFGENARFNPSHSFESMYHVEIMI